MKFYRVRRAFDRGIWASFMSPATLGTLAVLALLPLIIPALLLWLGLILILRLFDRKKTLK